MLSVACCAVNITFNLLISKHGRKKSLKSLFLSFPFPLLLHAPLLSRLSPDQEKWGDPPETWPAVRGFDPCLAAGPCGRPGEREASLRSQGRLELVPPHLARGAAQRWPSCAQQSHLGHLEVLTAARPSAAQLVLSYPVIPVLVLSISKHTSVGIISTCMYAGISIRWVCVFMCACERRGDARSCFMPESLHVTVRAGLRQQQSDFSCWRCSRSQLVHCASRLGRKDSPVTEGLMWCQGSVALFISNSTELGGVFKRERVGSGSWICARMLGFLAFNLDLCIVSQPLPASLRLAWRWASLSPWALQGETEKHFGSVSEIQ